MSKFSSALLLVQFGLALCMLVGYLHAVDLAGCMVRNPLVPGLARCMEETRGASALLTTKPDQETHEDTQVTDTVAYNLEPNPST